MENVLNVHLVITLTNKINVKKCLHLVKSLINNNKYVKFVMMDMN